MKKILSVAFLLVSIFANAQYISNLKMNYDGNFTTQDGKEYDVAMFEGKSATELFEMVRKHVSLAFNSPKDVESNIDDKIISIYGYAPDCTNYTHLIRYSLSFHYSLKFQFKDGKIKIEVPKIIGVDGPKNSHYRFLQTIFKFENIYNKEGILSEKPKKRQFVARIEDYFNNLINNIINGNKQANEDW